MAIEVPTNQQVCQRRLIEKRWAAIGGAKCGQQPLPKSRWQNEKTETEGRKERLAERADVHDSPLDIEAVHARNGPYRVAELAIVIIFDHPRSSDAGPLQQCEPAR